MSVTAPGSLADRLAARRRSREAKRASVLTLPVNGYEDMFAASYRCLPFEEMGDIVKLHEKVGEDTNDEVDMGADILIRSNIDLLEVTGVNPDGSRQYQSLDQTWVAPAITSLFQLPAFDNTREALKAALGSTDLMAHFKDYAERVREINEEEQEMLPGESEPSEEG
jgi:hypothetical protein